MKAQEGFDVTRTVLWTAALAVSLGLSLAAPSRSSAAGPGGDGQLLHRIDFGNGYVMGQAIKSGAVYLLNRKKSEIPSMLQERTDFRAEIRADAEVVDRGAAGLPGALAAKGGAR